METVDNSDLPSWLQTSIEVATGGDANREYLEHSSLVNNETRIVQGAPLSSFNASVETVDNSDLPAWLQPDKDDKADNNNKEYINHSSWADNKTAIIESAAISPFNASVETIDTSDLPAWLQPDRKEDVSDNNNKEYINHSSLASQTNASIQTGASLGSFNASVETIDNSEIPAWILENAKGNLKTNSQKADQDQPESSSSSGSNFSGSNFSGSYPSGSYFLGSYPSGSYFSGSYPSGSYFSSGHPSWNFFSGSYISGSYLSGSHPSGSYFSGSYPSGGYPSGSYFSGSYPSRSYFSGSHPSGSYFSGSYPSGSYFSGSY